MTYRVMKALLTAAVVMAALPGVPAIAATPPLAMAEKAATALSVEAGSGRVITLDIPVSNIFVADPKVAEVRPASPTTLFVFGVAPGRTTIAAMDAEGHLLSQYELTVQPSAYGARDAQAAVDRFAPNSHVKVQNQGKGLIVTGTVKSPADAARVMEIIKGYTPDGALINNGITIDSPLQVTLNVRIAQMSRDVVRNLGVKWSSLATIGSIARLPALTLNTNAATVANFSGIIDALAQDNLAHILAEPNLTVMSGQPASFQVGGEFPILVSQPNGGVTVQYKNYGVILSFLPTVLSDGRINLHIKPEVSALTSQGSVTVGTTVIQGLTVQRAETTVEMGSGESIAIAGLLQQATNDNGSGLPGLGDTPVIGALFRDSNFRRVEQELVIVVSPYIVRPVASASALHLPTDGYTPPPEIDRLLLMRQVGKQKRPVPVSIPGNAGFIVQ